MHHFGRSEEFFLGHANESAQNFFDKTDVSKYMRVSRDVVHRIFILLLLLNGMSTFSVDVAAADVVAEKLSPEAIEIEGLIKQGKGLMERGDVDHAIEVFNRVVALNSNSAEAYYHLGIIYVRKNDMPNGLKFLQKSVGLVPKNTKVRATLALAYERFNKIDDSIRQYRIVTEQAPGTAEGIEAEKNLNLLLVRQYAEFGNLDAALGLTAILRRDYSSDPRVLHAVGLVYFNFNHLEDAEVVFKQVVQLSPGSATPYFYLGKVYERSARIPLAVEQYKRAVLLDPESDFAHRATVRLGVIKAAELLKKEDFQGALKEFQAVLVLEPNEASALFNVGTIYRQLKQPDQAMEMFKRLIAIEPRNPEAHLRLGALYLEVGKLVEGSRELEKVLALSSKDTVFAKQAAAILGDMQATYGDRLTEARKLADQQDSYKEALKANADDLPAHFNLGVMYARQTMRDEALHEFGEVVRIDPGHAKAHNYIGALQDDQSKFSEAVEAYSKAISLEQDPEEVNKLIVRLRMAAAKKFYAEGNLGLAEAYFDELLVNDADNVTLLFYKALIHSARGDLGESERLYKKIIALSPNHIGARASLAFLYEQSNREEDAIKEYRYIVQNGGTGSAVDASEKRIPTLERRINGFSYSMGYSITYDNNSNLSEEKPFYEYISSLNTNFTYRYKLTRDIRTGISFSPAYVIYHYTQSDFLRTDIGPFITFGPSARNVTMGVTRTDMSGLLNEQRVSITDNYYLDIGWRAERPALLKWLAEMEERRTTSTSVRLNFSYRTLSNHGSPFFDSGTYAAGVAVSQALGRGRSSTLDFDYTDSQNKNPQGRDYAYRGFVATMRLDQSFTPRLAGSASYGFGYSYYLYPDSLYSFVTSEKKNRMTTLNSISLGLNYEMSDRVRLYANGSFQLSGANLPVQYTLSTEDVIGVGRSLGDFKKISLTAGMSLSF